ncbi:MAG: hypothetical protein ABIO60_07810 [Aquaticitalea sp.]
MATDLPNQTLNPKACTFQKVSSLFQRGVDSASQKKSGRRGGLLSSEVSVIVGVY